MDNFHITPKENFWNIWKLFRTTYQIKILRTCFTSLITQEFLIHYSLQIIGTSFYPHNLILIISVIYKIRFFRTCVILRVIFHSLKLAYVCLALKVKLLPSSKTKSEKLMKTTNIFLENAKKSFKTDSNYQKKL